MITYRNVIMLCVFSMKLNFDKIIFELIMFCIAINLRSVFKGKILDSVKVIWINAFE